MPQSTNLNKAPYFDDFDPNSNYYRVLFRPGFSIQSRELTTLQSTLQNQIESLARARYKQGSVVVPGELKLDVNYSYVKISSFTNNLAITDYIGKEVTGNSSGVTATVINATAETLSESATIFVKYESSGTNNSRSTFAEGETLVANSPGSPTLIVGITGNVKPTNSGALGLGSAVTVESGVYFINGTLVKNEAETVILDKYSNTPTYKVGFTIFEQLITSEEDLSLLDNAQGYSNFAAPGAHRLKITVQLNKRGIDVAQQRDFVELMSVRNGIGVLSVFGTESDFIFDDVLARRTFDESGDYVVRDFTLTFNEHLLSGNNNGLYTAASGGDDAKFVALMEPGKAYVKGYEIETTSVRYVDIDKARDTKVEENTFISPNEGANYSVKNLLSFPDVQSKSETLIVQGLVSTNAYQELKLYDKYGDIAFGETTGNLDEISPEGENFHILTITDLSNNSVVPTNTNYTNGSITGQVKTYFISADETRAVAVVTKSSSVSFNVGQFISMGATSGTVLTAERITTPYIGVAKTKYVKFLSGNSNNSLYDTDSLFKLGLFGVEYFVKIVCRNPLNFTVGKFITGQSSGAVGIVEQLLTDTKELVLSRVEGTFVEGETLLSEQDGTSTPYNFVQRDGTISYLKPVSFGSGYVDVNDISAININGNNAVSTIGLSNVTVLNNEIRGITLTDDVRVSLGSFDASPEVQIVSSTGSGAEYVAVLNTNSVTTYNSSFVRSFFGSTTGNFFGGDIASLQDDYILDNGSTFSATEGKYFITADNLGSRPDVELIHGDIISLTDNAGINRKYIVRFASKDGLGNTARIYVYGSILSSFTSKTISRVRSKLNNAATNTLIYPLPNKNVRSIVLDANDTNINYTVQREFLGSFDSSGSASITVGTGEVISGYNSSDYVMANPDTGRLIDLSGATLSFTNTNSTLTITLTSQANQPFKLLLPVRKFDTTPKTKVLVEDEEYNVTTGFGDPVIPLEHADGFRIKAIYMSSTAANATANDVDVTDRFVFDNGQRDTHYDLARIILRPGSIVPTNKLLVIYDYFKHVGDNASGDYFSVDSYTNISYKDIPSFNSTVFGNISLRDVVDFRPRVSDYTGLDTETVMPGYSDKKTVDALKFSGSGSQDPVLPVVGTSFDTSFEYYLNRIDAIYISKNGNFVVSKGTPSLNPQVPAEIEDSILLYHLNIPAYTYSIDDVNIKKYDNRRYTMKDIGSLEKRIEKLEYYTVLSLLEQDTFNKQVRDEFGNERFKNGILVDNFEGHNIGNTLSQDYKCSIDTQTGVLRPSYFASQTKLIEESTNDSQRSASNYVRTGEIALLEYTEESLVSTTTATTEITINTAKATKYSGSLTLSPNVDEWKNTVTTPSITSNNNGVFDTYKNNNSNQWGSIWDEWSVEWTGTSAYGISNSTNFTGSSDQFANSTNPVIKGKTRSRTRNGTQNRMTPYGSNIRSINGSSKVVSNDILPVMRTKIIYFVAKGLEPDTQLYAFFDGVDVSAWVNPDDVTNVATPFTGTGGYAPAGYGNSIITDSNGSISGSFLIPDGYPPTQGKKDSDLKSNPDSFYDTSATSRSFFTGVKSFRLTSSSTNSTDNSSVFTFVESPFFAAGALETRTNSISSTRPSYINRNSPSNSDTVKPAGSSITNINESGLLAPIAQTFKVSGFDEGVFVSSVDLYFSNKKTTSDVDDTRPTTVYLTEMKDGAPSRTVIPFSQSTVESDTKIRILISNDYSSGITLKAGETVTGSTSGAVATLKSDITLTTANTRYILTCTTHNGTSFIPGESLIVNRSPSITVFTIEVDEDAGIIEEIKVTNFGSGYDENTTSINITGDIGGTFGSSATASAKIYDGRIYAIEVTNQGSGYKTVPGVTISGGDGLATATAVFRVTDPAVRMGITTSTDGSSRTRFNLASPVYLQSDTTYAIVVSTPSSSYKLYSSVVGDQVLNSSALANSNINVGSLFKSQNATAWVQDASQSLKFSVNRCVFDTSTTANIVLKNEDLDFVSLPNNPISVDSTQGVGSLFGANQKVVRINHPNHGMKEGDFVVLAGVQGFGANNTIFGIPVSLFNGLHSVQNVGIDDYCILLDTDLWNTANPSMTGSGSGGGTLVRATTNRLYNLISPQIGILNFPSTTVSQNIRTAYGKSVDVSTTNEYTLAESEVIQNDDNYYFETTRVVASRVNEVYRGGITLLNGEPSIKYTISLQTNKDSVSPVVDLNRCNLITVSNRSDNPDPTDDRFGSIAQTLTVPTGSDYEVSTVSPDTIETVEITYSNATGGVFTNTVDSASRLVQGGISGQIVQVDTTNQKLKVIDANGIYTTTGGQITQGSVTANISSIKRKSGIVIGWDSGTGSLRVKLTSSDRFAVGDIINDDNTGTTPKTFRAVSAVDDGSGFLYVSENAGFGGVSASKYLTKEVTLETAATSLDCKITANLYNNSDVKLYYKIKPDGSTEDFNKISWEAFNGNGLSDNNADVIPSNLKSLSPSVEDLDSYVEYKYTADDLKPFISFAIKIVFAGDPALAPRVEDLSVIAHS